MHSALEAVQSFAHEPVPLHLRNAPTKLMASLGYGKEYQYPHDFRGGHVPGETYLPERLAGRRFYEPSDRGYEKTIGERLERLKERE